MASTPTTTGLSSPSRSPKKDHTRLRHPSRLRSKDLNENVFRIYLSHVLISTLPLPESLPDDSISEKINNSTPRPSRVRSSEMHPETTPKRPSRVDNDVFGSPTPKKPTAQYQLAAVPAELTGPLLGVTLSYLRRVQVLAHLARRVVDQAAHERDKVLRHAEKSARAKYEASHPPDGKNMTRPATARSNANELKSLSRPKVQSASASLASKSPREDSRSCSASTAHMHPSSTSSRALSSAAKPPSRTKAHQVEALTPTESARRATYHSKQSKLHAEDAAKRHARMKRLFEAALRTLVSEGGAVLHDGPKRHVPSSNKHAGKMTLPGLSGMWLDPTNTASTGSSRDLSAASSLLSGQACSELENTLEDGDEAGELSDPSDSEDAYLPVTAHTLRPALLAALRQSLMRHRGGVDFASWMRTLKGDEQWARVPDLVLRETLDVLREEEWIDKVGAMKFFALAVAAFLPLLEVSQAAPTIAARDCSVIPSTANAAVRDQVYRITQSRAVTAKVLLATFETAWIESHVNNLNCGDQDSIGVFQQRPSQGWGTYDQIMNVDYSTGKFLDQAIVNDRNNPGYTAGQLAQSVQRSEFPDRYDQAQSIAQDLINQARASVGGTNPGTGGCAGLSGYSASAVYTGGQSCSYGGHKWTAKWWTQGETPSTGGSGVWQDNGAC
ncbi:hypothetical protein FRC07_001284 [Ceratobasidium sp. 392]|nr:hypothetical protein FRC07_001284 [Ceratobasidium sp. 392]